MVHKQKTAKLDPVELPSIATRVLAELRNQWERAVLYLVGPSLFKFVVNWLLKDYLLSKLVDSFFSRFAEFGLWLTSYKLAWLTLGVVLFILWLVIAVVREAYTERKSAIVDLHGNPYTIKRVSQRAGLFFVSGSVAIIALLISGVMAFYRYTPDVLLEKYPLGYVIFKIDSRNEVFPFVAHDFLDKYDFDWNSVKIKPAKSQFNLVDIRLP